MSHRCQIAFYEDRKQNPPKIFRLKLDGNSSVFNCNTSDGLAEFIHAMIYRMQQPDYVYAAREILAQADRQCFMAVENMKALYAGHYSYVTGHDYACKVLDAVDKNIAELNKALSLYVNRKAFIGYMGHLYNVNKREAMDVIYNALRSSCVELRTLRRNILAEARRQQDIHERRRMRAADTRCVEGVYAHAARIRSDNRTLFNTYLSEATDDYKIAQDTGRPLRVGNALMMSFHGDDVYSKKDKIRFPFGDKAVRIYREDPRSINGVRIDTITLKVWAKDWLLNVAKNFFADSNISTQIRQIPGAEYAEEVRGFEFKIRVVSKQEVLF